MSGLASNSLLMMRCHGRGAAQWAQALYDWLMVTEDKVHVVTGSRDSSLAGRRFQFLIVSYNMVRLITAS